MSKEKGKNPVSMPYENTLDRVEGSGGNSTKGTSSSKLGGKKAEHVTASQRYSNDGFGDQPTRNADDKATMHGVQQTGGNIPVEDGQREECGQSKAERIPASRRW